MIRKQKCYKLNDLVKYHLRMVKLNKEILQESTLKRIHAKTRKATKEHEAWIKLLQKLQSFCSIEQNEEMINDE